MPNYPSENEPSGAASGVSSRPSVPTETSPAAIPSPSSDTGGSARTQIREVKDRVVDQTRSSMRDARDKAVDSLSDSRRRAADQIGNLATAFHRTSEHLRTEDQASVAKLADTVARRVDSVSTYLRDTEMATMVDDLERLARRRPAAVLGLGLVLGMVGARFLKSSSRESRKAGGLNARA